MDLEGRIIMRNFAVAMLIAAEIVLCGALAGCGAGSINGPVEVAAGQKTGDVSTVNGDVTVGDGATVGSAMTVNGSVSLGANVTGSSVKTVNGGIKLGDTSKVTGDLTTVNGPITLAAHSEVAGSVTNVNGPIKMISAHVGGGITTINADIDIEEGSHVEGGIHVDKATFNSERHVPRIVIGPNTVVNGPLRFEREVKLYVSDSAQVSGPIDGATAEKFSGSQP
jgi:hypothetical protein